MARLSALLLAVALGAACAVALASCGSGNDANLLPGTTADEIEVNLDAVEQLAAEQDCFGAEDAVAQVAAEVEELEGVDVKLKRALEDGTARLSEVVGRCEEEETEETEPSVETEVEPEEVEDEKEKKPKKEKPEKEEPAETEEEPAEGEGPDLPPQANGKGEEKGGGPPAEPETEETPSSGGVGPGVGVE
jgi:outer membrane biosynthesis protein TonB